MNRVFLSFTFLILNLYSHQALAFDYSHSFQNDQAAIDYLLQKIENSQGTFIRNGKKHKAKEAKEHLEHKVKMAKRMFWFFGPEKEISLQDFVEKIASKSSTTGMAYQIRLPNGKLHNTRDWLQLQIEEARELKSKKPQSPNQRAGSTH